MLLSTVRNTARGNTSRILSNLLNEVRPTMNLTESSTEQRNIATDAPGEQKSQFPSAGGREPPARPGSGSGSGSGSGLGPGARPTKVKQLPPLLRRDKQQQAARKKSTAYIPGTVNLQVLGAGANGAPCSVYLFTDQARYLFNCGEGTQRLAHEHKTKLSRLEQIFVTRNTWPMTGGFPGLALTVQDAGVRELALHGPPHLDSILHSMKRFVVLKSLQVVTKDCTQEHDFEDATMKVQCVPLYRKPAPDGTGASTSETVVIAYICKLKPRPGTLNLEKCVEHGVPPGPLLGLLKNGIDVTLDNGRVVKSEDVSEPGETPQSFVFIDIPTEEFLPALQDNAALFHDAKDVALLVHFSPAHILANNCYKSFMQKVGTHPQHIYLNSPENGFSGYIATHRIQYQLNQLSDRMFPLLAEDAQPCNTAVAISSELKKTKLSDAIGMGTPMDVLGLESNGNDALSVDPGTCINSLTNFHLRPRRGLDRTSEAKLHPIEYISETQVLEGFPALLQKLKDDMELLKPSNTAAYPKITFLGTGSCIPNKTRNVSSILVEPQEDSYILLDCGEGTHGQIVRFFGKSKAEQVMSNLKAIYVSHLHADHHIGLIGLINERQRLARMTGGGSECDRQKLLLFAPVQIQPWLSFYDERIQQISDAYELIGNSAMLEEPLDLTVDHADMGVASIATCLVRHCPHSFGVSLTLASAADANGKPVKITYSGDSMPCSDLVELGRDSTILIHEATMEDDLVEEAKIKMHSTISQAIAQGHAMAADHIILTHFSQRYAKLPRMQNISGEAESAAMRNVAIAFDNMQVTLGDLQYFHVLYPALRALFAEHADELELKALKRELKLERKRKLMND